MSLDLENRLTALETKLDSLISSFITHSQHSVKSFKATDDNFEIINEKVETINSKVETINAKVDCLMKDSNKEFSVVGEQLGEIKQELIKLQKVSNYTQEYENLLTIAK